MNDVRLRRAEENTPELRPISADDVIELAKDLQEDFEGTINRRKRTFRSTLIDRLDELDKQRKEA